MRNWEPLTRSVRVVEIVSLFGRGRRGHWPRASDQSFEDWFYGENHWDMHISNTFMCCFCDPTLGNIVLGFCWERDLQAVLRMKSDYMIGGIYSRARLVISL